jgi:hypothetical protein
MTFLVVLTATGCASTQTVEGASELTNEQWDQSIKPGDTVLVETVGGKRLEFKVAVVEPGWIIGEGQRVRREDIATLQVQRRGFTKWFAESDIDGGGIAYVAVVGLLVILAFAAF